MLKATFVLALLLAARPGHATTIEDCDKQNGDETIAGCTMLIEANPENSTAYNNRGIQYSRKREFDRAINDFSKAIEIDPDKAIYYFNRAIALFELGAPQRRSMEIERAVEDYTSAIERDPGYATAINNRGFAYATLKQHDRAIEDYDRAIEIDPKHISAYYYRGLSCMAIKDYDCARRDFDKFVELDPKNPRAYRIRAWLKEREGKSGAAIADYRRALTLKPDAQLSAVIETALTRLGAIQSEECSKRISAAEACHNRALSEPGPEKNASLACVIANCNSIKVLGDNCKRPEFCR